MELQEAATTTAVADSTGFHYKFEINIGGLEAGNNVKMVKVYVRGYGLEHVDDNWQQKYCSICKDRAKFQPGKSLW